jgi:hypothetical protein
MLTPILPAHRVVGAAEPTQRLFAVATGEKDAAET